MNSKDFQPAIRFTVVSDIHYHEDEDVERQRMAHALEKAYELAESSPNYKRLDAIFVNGDFTNTGTEKQMQDFKKTLDGGVREGTEVIINLASHEFSHSKERVEPVTACLKSLFGMEPDCHRVIKGFHFISLSTTFNCRFSQEKIDFAAQELKKARQANPKSPIFFFQHPHVLDTVAGSIKWGVPELYSTLMSYPQVIDFSGHSHAPVNDPRSIHQKHFTCLGTGSLCYFELDEFDKYYGTKPPLKEQCAQMLMVEASAEGAVRVYPYDLITDNFFPLVWEIQEPWNPSSFKYTDERYRNEKPPIFPKDWQAHGESIGETGFRFVFSQAEMPEGYVNDYSVTVKEAKTGVTVAKKCLWSEYYFYDMPKTLAVDFEGLEPDTEYLVTVTAGGFFGTYTDSEAVAVGTLCSDFIRTTFNVNRKETPPTNLVSAN